jgi:hypothetical protein
MHHQEEQQKDEQIRSLQFHLHKSQEQYRRQSDIHDEGSQFIDCLLGSKPAVTQLISKKKQGDNRQDAINFGPFAS